MALLVFGHVDADHRLLVVKEELGQRPRQLGLAHARGPHEDEAADRPVRVLDAGPRAAHGVGHDGNGLVLADHAHAETVFHVEQLLHLAFQHPAHRDAGPLGNDLRHVLLVHLFLQDLGLRLELGQLRRFRVELFLELEQLAVAQFGGPAQIALALRLFRVDLRLLDLFLDGPDLLDALLFRLPLRPQAAPLFRQIGDLLLDLRQPFARRGVLSPSSRPRARSRAAGSCAPPRRAPTGMLSISMRSRDAASSIRSMALSGRNRSAM